jgi:putative Mg2+ transporter-C (MgtC) family protein
MMPALQLEVLGEVALAMLLGAAIGLDRELAHKPAGLRTHMLVAGAAALLVGLGFALIEHALVTRAVVAADPIRIIQAIVIGVSFLGAGTIFRDERHHEMQGLTTAASLLMSSGLGIAVALRQFTLAIGTVALVAIVLRLLSKVERRLHRDGNG